ncbi:MAG: MarR family transcriptional regulator [Bacteroidetes bacterium]|nr:MAG: MarR family transcriptional regulator [Bacteroidota bacterium]
MNIEETVDYHIRATLFKMMRMYNLYATENGITQGIGYVLILITKEGVPATKIAPLMGMGTSSLTRLLKKMENDDLVYRQTDEVDKRVVRIFLTEKGVQLREKAKAVVLNFNEKLFKQISKKEMEDFVKVSAIIRAQIKNEIEIFQENKNS